jgi:hypothetical protein
MIRKLIDHAAGHDEEFFEHYMNWLAVIAQYRERTGTSCIFHGTQGTGKGLMLNRILKPLFGEKYVEVKRMEELDSKFNAFMEGIFILFVDEAQASSFGNKDVMDANIKNYIVESQVSIRRMHTNPYKVQNYANLIFASNKDDPVIIAQDDRRFNVAAYQPKKIIMPDTELRVVEDELPDFWHYLNSRDADKEQARTPLNNAAKDKMVHLSQSSIDIACAAILDGNYEFFEDQRQHIQIQGASSVAQDIIAGAYSALLDDIKAGNKEVLLREEIQLILEYTIGNMPKTPYKFSSLLKHHRIQLGPVNYKGKTVRGIKVNWKV